MTDLTVPLIDVADLGSPERVFQAGRNFGRLLSLDNSALVSASLAAFMTGVIYEAAGGDVSRLTGLIGRTRRLMVELADAERAAERKCGPR